MELTVTDMLWRLAAVLVLVFANGFFVAAEFAIVSVRKTRVDQLIAEGHRGARVVRRAVTDPDSYIAATQLGITMASLGLGWIGEPALATMIEPAFRFLPDPHRRDHRAQHRRDDCLRDRDGPPYRVRRAGSQDDRARTSRSHGAPRREAHRAVHEGVLAVHPGAERRGTGRRADARIAQQGRPRDGPFGGGAEDAGDRQPGSGRARGRRRADAAPRLRFRRSHRRANHDAAHRDRRGRRRGAEGRADRGIRRRTSHAPAGLPHRSRRCDRISPCDGPAARPRGGRHRGRRARSRARR